MKSFLNIATFAFLSWIIVFISCKKEILSNIGGNSNKPPIANAGPDQVITLPTESVSLDGSASGDPNGTISSFQLTKIFGPVSFNISNSAIAKTVIKNLTAGVYQVELKVTSNEGLSAKDTVEIIVNDPSKPNGPPIANAGVDQTITLPANTVTIDGSGCSDPEMNIVSYTWTKISGPSSFNITNTNVVQTQITDLAEGIYQFELKVTDAGWFSSKDTVQIAVYTIPLIQPGGERMEMIITLPIDSAWIDDWDRADESYYWTKIAGPTSFFIVNSYGPRTLVKSLVPGTYSFLKVPYSYRGPADTVDIKVIDDLNDRNTITYQNLFWEYNWAFDSNSHSPTLKLWKPSWLNNTNPAIEVFVQMDFINNAEWFKVPSTQAGIYFSVDCSPPAGPSSSSCLGGFVIRTTPEDLSWNGRSSNIKVKVL